MIQLGFAVEDARALPHTAVPQLGLRVAVSNQGPAPVQSGLLCCQVRIDPARRPHSPNERERLLELFGAPEQWSRSLRSLFWTQSQVTLPAFGTQTLVELPVPCSWDFNLAAVKYFDGLEDGEVPLRLLFSGTVFYRQQPAGPVQVWPVPWSSECEYRLPLRVWRGLIEEHYPNSAFLGLRKDVFDRLRRFKAREALPTWEQVIERLLDGARA